MFRGFLIGVIRLAIVVGFLRITLTQCLTGSLRWRSRAAEVQAQRVFAFALRGYLALDLLSVIAAFRQGLRAGFQPGLDLQDFS